MKKQKIDEVRGMLSKGQPEDLPEDLAEFYKQNGYKKTGPKHFAVIVNPTDQHKAMAEQLGKVIETHTIFLTEKTYSDENI